MSAATVVASSSPTPAPSSSSSSAVVASSSSTSSEPLPSGASSSQQQPVRPLSSTVKTENEEEEEDDRASSRVDPGGPCDDSRHRDPTVRQDDITFSMNGHHHPTHPDAPPLSTLRPPGDPPYHPPRQHDRDTATASESSGGADNNNNNLNNDNDFLPAELRSILEEVAVRGDCAWLPWSSSSLDGGAAFPNDGPTVEPADDPRTLPSQQQQQPKKEKGHWLLPASSIQQSKRQRLNGVLGAAGPATSKRKFGIIDSPGFGESKADDGAGGIGSRRKRPLAGQGSRNSHPTGDDSEGTATTDSSGKKKPAAALRAQRDLDPSQGSLPQRRYASLRGAFREALHRVLDYYYRRKGGYTLSPAEARSRHIVRRDDDRTIPPPHPPREEWNHPTWADNDGEERSHSPVQGGAESDAAVAVRVFEHRRRRLLNTLSPESASLTPSPHQTSLAPPLEHDPPFTIQRVAEILIAPERFYSQTHKLCNALEKLLLVTSSARSFGGVAGGTSIQSQREEQELRALVEEQDRIQSELRRRRLRQQRALSALDEPSDPALGSPVRHHGDSTTEERTSSLDGMDSSSDRPAHGTALLESGSSNLESREILDAAARASLRHKFDHVGIDPHASSVVSRDVRAIAESRGMTNSPPPPSLSISAAVTAYSGGLLRHHSPDGELSPPGRARAHSPILFGSAGVDGASSSPPMAAMHPGAANLHLLQIHHPVSLAGVSPFELASLHRSASPASSGLAAAALAASMLSKEVDVESRSSASSDVDSESDVSFDDSASDRSDGSDSGHYEPFSAARAMTLNRMQQQQQQRLQSRLQPPPLHSAQGGDGVGRADLPYATAEGTADVNRAEDSGGSDSSSSDVAD